MQQMAPALRIPAVRASLALLVVLAITLTACDTAGPAKASPTAATPTPTPCVSGAPGTAATCTTDLAAAIASAQQQTHTIYTTGTCPAGQSCLTNAQVTDGVDAAIVSFNGGPSGGAFCSAYVYKDAAGWHPLDTACGEVSGLFPIPNKRITVRLPGGGCVNVHAAPGVSSAVVGCLNDGTAAFIDDGPTFVDDIRASDGVHIGHIWWHLQGKGWIAHDFLVNGFVQSIAQ